MKKRSLTFKLVYQNFLSKVIYEREKLEASESASRPAAARVKGFVQGRESNKVSLPAVY